MKFLNQRKHWFSQASDDCKDILPFWIVLALKMHVICRFFRFQGVIVEIFALKQLMPFKNKPPALRDYHFFCLVFFFLMLVFSEIPKGSSDLDLDGFIWRPGIHAAMTKPISMDWENSGLINGFYIGESTKTHNFFIKGQFEVGFWSNSFPIIFPFLAIFVGWFTSVRYVCPTQRWANEVTRSWKHLPSTCKGLSPTWNRTHRHVWKPILVGGGHV